MKFSRGDFWKAVTAGEAIALLVLPVFKNLGILNLPGGLSGNLLFWFILLWLIFFPAATVVGLYVFYLVAVAKWKIVFQIGKYGIVGWLNVFLVAGVLNFLTWSSGVERGLLVDGFAIIAFILGTVNSFWWNKLWTFGSRVAGDTKREYVRFFVVSVSVSLLSTGLIHLMINVFGAPVGFNSRLWLNIAIGITIPLSFLGNFFGYKIFVFKDKKA